MPSSPAALPPRVVCESRPAFGVAPMARPDGAAVIRCPEH